MDSKLLLCKACTLLYRESQLSDRVENSADLVRTVLESVQVSDIGIGINSDREVIMSLKTTILEMASYPQDHDYDKTDLLQRLRLNCGNDDKLYEAFRQGIEDEIQEASLKRSVVNMRKAIQIHFKEEKVSDILNKASSSWKFNRDKVKSVTEFISSLVAQLEPFQVETGAKDNAVIDDIDIGNEESLRGVFANVASMNSGQRVYKTGWPALDRMLLGGFRPGEFWTFPGLQHKYKTGLNLSLFAQVAMFNKPMTTDPNKKPMLLRISFEDPVVNNLQFLYQYLKYSDTREYVDIKSVSVEEMTQFVKEKLQGNGWSIKLMHVDPNAWNYRSLCNKIIELEAQGYAIEGVWLDYAYKLNKEGMAQGPAGTDILDLIGKLRNFFGARGTFVVNPHQVSAEGKMLLRGAISEDQFVKELNGRGYFEGSKGIDRIVDGLIWIHLFKHMKDWYLSLQLDKHRYPTITADENKYFLLKFPPRGMPIPHSNTGEDESFVKLSAPVSNTNDDLFKLG